MKRAARDLARRVQGVVASALPEPQRPDAACDVEGLSYREIAEVLNCPIGTVMSRLHNARKRVLGSTISESFRNFLGLDDESVARTGMIDGKGYGCRVRLKEMLDGQRDPDPAYTGAARRSATVRRTPSARRAKRRRGR